MSRTPQTDVEAQHNSVDAVQLPQTRGTSPTASDTVSRNSSTIANEPEPTTPANVTPRDFYAQCDFSGSKGRSLLVCYSYNNDDNDDDDDEQRAFILPVHRPCDFWFPPNKPTLAEYKSVVPWPDAQALRSGIVGEDEKSIWRRVKSKLKARHPWWYFNWLFWEVNVVEEANTEIICKLSNGDFKIKILPLDFSQCKQETQEELKSVQELISQRWPDQDGRCEVDGRCEAEYKLGYSDSSHANMHISTSSNCVEIYLLDLEIPIICEFVTEAQLKHQLAALDFPREHLHCFRNPERASRQPLREWYQESPIYDHDRLGKLVQESCHSDSIHSKPRVRCVRISYRRKDVPVEPFVTVAINILLFVVWRLVQGNWDMPTIFSGPFVACLLALYSTLGKKTSRGPTVTKQKRE